MQIFHDYILVGCANLEERVHKSKLGGFIIDCRTDDLQGAAEFWSAALGMAVRDLPGGQPPGGEADFYRKLEDSQHDLHIEVQKVDHPSRVHLDIETNDISAEVHRLESLGAKKVQQISTWWVMEAPTGQRFCVVPAGSSRFEERASEWT
jgi:catechol 2,3-dioxygenase-like lactoylglutathione lyase family enzyme